MHDAIVLTARRRAGLEEAQGQGGGNQPRHAGEAKKFDDKYGLGFPLLADENHNVAQAWGTWGKKTLYGRSFMGIIRSAFVVDEKGKLADVFYKVSPKATVPKVTEALEG